MLDKVGQPPSPFGVVKGGNRHMHAATTGVSCKDSRGSFSIAMLGAPAVAMGERPPIRHSEDQRDITKGFHFGLFHNAWGTNYIQWFGEDMRFRFLLIA